MANLQKTLLTEFVDKRVHRGFASSPLSDIHKYDDPDSLRAALNSVSSTTYSTSRLDKMTINDMIYAVRLNYDLAGIK